MNLDTVCIGWRSQSIRKTSLGKLSNGTKMHGPFLRLAQVKIAIDKLAGKRMKQNTYVDSLQYRMPLYSHVAI